MKQKHFYSHLIEISDITIELADMDLSPEERVHLLSLIDANIHSAVVNTVLSELPEEEKKAFLRNLTGNDHMVIWIHLRENIKNVDEKLILAVNNLKKELLKDLKEVNNKN